MTTINCGIKDIGDVDWSDVVDLGVENYEDDLPFVPSVKDKRFHSYKSHKQKGRGHSIRDAIIKRKVKAAREKLEQLEAEKLEADEAKKSNKRKRETAHVSPENSKKLCLGTRLRLASQATTKTVSSSSDSLPAFGPSQEDIPIHIPQDVTTDEQEFEVPTIEQALDLAKKMETNDHVEHDVDGIWEEIDGEEWQEEHYKIPSALAQSYSVVGLHG